MRLIALVVLAAALGILTTITSAWVCAWRKPSAASIESASMVFEADGVKWTISDSRALGLRWRAVTAERTFGPHNLQSLMREQDIYDGDLRVTETFIAQVLPGEKQLRGRYRAAIHRLEPDASAENARQFADTALGADVALRGGWGRIPDLIGPARQPPRTARATAAGWPLPALWGWQTTTYQHNVATATTTPLTLDERGLFTPPLAAAASRSPLPCLPIWPGFFLNALLYASLWLPPLAAPLILRRWRRRRRGWCLRCGYDLAGISANICPECGTARKQKPSSRDESASSRT